MEGVFEIIQETEDKFDSCTMWWHGEARCSQCHQKVSFDYRSGYQNTGDIRVA
jgi:hypothetical protein